MFPKAQAHLRRTLIQMKQLVNCLDIQYIQSFHQNKNYCPGTIIFCLFVTWCILVDNE